jgi:hypothetical protein
MLHTIQSRQFKGDPPYAVYCPFCGSNMFWQEFDHGGDGWELFFCHRGVITDKECVLSGMTFAANQLSKWNKRFE